MVHANNVMLIFKVRVERQTIIAVLGPAAIWKTVASEFKAEYSYGILSNC